MDAFKQEQWTDAMKAVLGPEWAVAEGNYNNICATRGREYLTYDDDEQQLEYDNDAPNIRNRFSIIRPVYGGDSLSEAIAKIVVAGRIMAEFFMVKDDVGLLGYRRPDAEEAAK